jgi:hypothetical protein
MDMYGVENLVNCLKLHLNLTKDIGLKVHFYNSFLRTLATSVSKLYDNLMAYSYSTSQHLLATEAELCIALMQD